MSIKVTINDREWDVDDTMSVLDATASGIELPTLCKMENRPAIGACRLCVVEVEGARTLQAACATPVRDGMVIRTQTRRVREARRTIVELLLSEHCGDCQTCNRSGDCELQDMPARWGFGRCATRANACPARLTTAPPH